MTDPQTQSGPRLAARRRSSIGEGGSQLAPRFKSFPNLDLRLQSAGWQYVMNCHRLSAVTTDSHELSV